MPKKSFLESRIIQLENMVHEKDQKIIEQANIISNLQKENKELQKDKKKGE